MKHENNINCSHFLLLSHPTSLFLLPPSALLFLFAISPPLLLLYKGSLKVYPLSENKYKEPPYMFPKEVSTQPIECVVRAYIIRVRAILYLCWYIRETDRVYTIMLILNTACLLNLSVLFFFVFLLFNRVKT